MYEFDKCTVYDANGKSVGNGIIRSSENGVFDVKFDRNDGLYEGQSVRLFILDPVRGQCRFEARTLWEDQFSAVFGDLKSLGSVQNRNNTRVNKKINTRIVTKIVTDKITGEETEEKLEKPIDITILNISAQGLYFNCGHKLDIGFKFALSFFETKRPLRLRVRIIRAENYIRSCNYGCLLEIPEKDMDELYRFVIKEQIEQRKNELR